MKYKAETLISFDSGRRYIRNACKADSWVPINLINGNSAPKYVGNKHHYETSGGRMIYHPSAYSKSGWSNMRYVHSTLKVEVGSDWTPNKEFFDLSKTVNSICYKLNNMGFDVIMEAHSHYSIVKKDNSICYTDLSLSEFRKHSYRLLNLIVFS